MTENITAIYKQSHTEKLAYFMYGCTPYYMM